MGSSVAADDVFGAAWLSEADPQVHSEYVCMRSGMQRPAYVPVMASG